jgi:multidrug efflux pump subunit AcrB
MTLSDLSIRRPVFATVLSLMLLILGIIVVSVMPVVIEAIKAWRGARA